MEKTIHVDAYTRSDGTRVREHERHIHTNGDYQDFESNENKGLLENLKEILSQSKTRENELLEQLAVIGVGNQADILKMYSKIKNNNNELKKILDTLKYFDEARKEAEREKHPILTDTVKNIRSNILHPDDGFIKALDDNPEAAQNFMDWCINAVGPIGMEDVQQLWNLASHGFDEDDGSYNLYKEQAWEYVNKNGKMYQKINDLPLNDEIKQKVRQKVKEQLHTNDIEGFIFDENSSLANKIIESDRFKKVIEKHIHDFLNYKTVNTSFSYAKSNLNLWGGIGCSDILDLHLTLDGHLEGYILDTYDFNEDGMILIRMGNSVQKHGKFHSYYTLTKIRI